MIPVTASSPLVAEMYREVWSGLQPILSILGIACSLSSGIAMLKGKDWGRKLYLISTPILSLITAFIVKSMFLVIIGFGLPFYILSAFFVLRKDASNYFEGIPLPEPVPVTDARLPAWQSPKTSAPQESNNAKRFAAIFLLFVGGIFFMTSIMMVTMALESVIAAVIISFIFLAITGALVFGGVWLWGRSRWMLVIGVFLVACAIFTFVMGAMFINFASPEMQKAFQGQSFDAATALKLGKSSMVASLFPFLIGVALILVQKRRDKQPVQLGLN